MSTGIPSNTHKQYGDTGFPSNVPPLQAEWALRTEEEKHGKGFPAFSCYRDHRWVPSSPNLYGDWDNRKVPIFLYRGQQSCLFYDVSIQLFKWY